METSTAQETSERINPSGKEGLSRDTAHHPAGVTKISTQFINLLSGKNNWRGGQEGQQAVQKAQVPSAALVSSIDDLRYYNDALALKTANPEVSMQSLRTAMDDLRKARDTVNNYYLRHLELSQGWDSEDITNQAKRDIRQANLTLDTASVALDNKNSLEQDKKNIRSRAPKHEFSSLFWRT